MKLRKIFLRRKKYNKNWYQSSKKGNVGIFQLLQMKRIEGGKPNLKLNYLCKNYTVKIYVGFYTNTNQLDNVNSRIEWSGKQVKLFT